MAGALSHIRVLDLSEEDLRPFRLGRDAGAGAAADLPALQVPRDEPRDAPIVRDPTTNPPADPPAKPTFPQPLEPRCTNPPCG